MPSIAMISRSSWCALMPMCVVRANAASAGSPSGTKICAVALLKFIILFS